MKKMYEGILNSPSDGLEQSIIQIKRDINRTYPNQDLFKKDSKGYQTLESLLITYWKYDRCIGYVQGMNFIMGSLMYHCVEPDITFWLFVTVIEQYQLWDNYKGDLKGIGKHWGAIKILIKEELPKLSEHFIKNEMTIGMFATDWILGLFASIISLDYMGRFYDHFFEERWMFFYKTVIVFLKDIQAELLQEEEMCDVLVTLKTLATPLRSEYSPIPSKKNLKSTILSTFNKFGNETEESPRDVFISPNKNQGFSILGSVRDIFSKKQYECDWYGILNRAQKYKIKSTQAVKEYCINYDLTH